MVRSSLSPKVGLSVALGLLLASAGAPARASFDGRDDAPSAFRSFELIPPGHASELPPELRMNEDALSAAEGLGLPSASGGHTVQLHWVVREGRGLSGYRVTLVSADGLPGHLAARWWVAPTQGTPVGDGLTAYSAEISLAFSGQAPVFAAIEAIDSDGQAILLGVRRSVAEADTTEQASLAARPDALSVHSTVLLLSRLAPVAPGTAAAATFVFRPASALRGLLPQDLLSSRTLSGPASPRGPPAAGITL